MAVLILVAFLRPFALLIFAIKRDERVTRGEMKEKWIRIICTALRRLNSYVAIAGAICLGSFSVLAFGFPQVGGSAAVGGEFGHYYTVNHGNLREITSRAFVWYLWLEFGMFFFLPFAGMLAALRAAVFGFPAKAKDPTLSVTWQEKIQNPRFWRPLVTAAILGSFGLSIMREWWRVDLVDCVSFWAAAVAAMAFVVAGSMGEVSSLSLDKDSVSWRGLWSAGTLRWSDIDHIKRYSGSMRPGLRVMPRPGRGKAFFVPEYLDEYSDNGYSLFLQAAHSQLGEAHFVNADNQWRTGVLALRLVVVFVFVITGGNFYAWLIGYSP